MEKPAGVSSNRTNLSPPLPETPPLPKHVTISLALAKGMLSLVEDSSHVKRVQAQK